MDILQARTQRSQIQTVGDGNLAPARLLDAYALATSDAHGRYFDAVRRGNVFFVTSSGTQALSLNTATTATGILLWNPPSSGVNLVLLEAMVMAASLPAGAYATLLTGGAQAAAPTGTATTTVANGILNALITSGAASKAVVYSGGTMSNAVIQRILGLGAGATMASSTSYPPPAKDDIGGAIVLPPGTITSLQAITTAVTVLGQLTWEECPI